LVSSNLKISIVIPVKNGEVTLNKCLQAISSQTIASAIQIIVLDSQSTDKSVSIAKQYNVKIVPIKAGEFNHGLSRNFALQFADAALVYFTVQDAYLAANDTLERMSNLFDDVNLMSVTGVQAIPHDENKNPAVWFKPVSKPEQKILYFKAGEFQKLSGVQQAEQCTWDNVNSMYRKTALQAQPFEKTDLSEDMLWAKSAHIKGWKLIRDSSLLVYHYHHQTIKYNFKTNYAAFYASNLAFNIRPSYPKVILPFLRRVNIILKEKSLSFFTKLYWVFHNAGIFLAHFFSVLVFRSVYFFGGNKALTKSAKLFNKSVPQGQQK
jgi:rhamnosyltransferase